MWLILSILWKSRPRRTVSLSDRRPWKLGNRWEAAGGRAPEPAQKQDLPLHRPNTNANTDHPSGTQRGSGNQLRITGNSQLILDPKELMVHRCAHVASCERAREPRHLSAESRNALLRF